jgi:uncharacterized membrane protein YcgQ (UPF0703/DUF1980 family)
MSFTPFAWRGIGRVFKVIHLSGFQKALSWDIAKRRLQKNTKPKWGRWALFTILSSLVSLVFPPYLFLQNVFSKNAFDRELETVEITTLIVYFSTGLASIPVLIKTIFERSDFALGFNIIVDMETTISGKKDNITLYICVSVN